MPRRLQEPLELRDVAHRDLEEEVLFAGDVVTLEDLGERRDDVEEALVVREAVLLERDVDERKRRSADGHRSSSAWRSVAVVQ